LLGSMLFNRWTGLLGAAVVAFTPVFLEWGTSLWADVPGTCFIVGALAAYVAACRKKTRMWRIVLGGVAGAMTVLTVLIKYSDILVLLPIFVYAVCTQRRAMLGSVVNWTFGVVVIVGMIGLGVYNHTIYGSPLDTHYSASRSGFHFPLLSISYALGPSPFDGYSLLGVGRTLWSNFSWLLALAVLGLAKASRKAVSLLLGLFLVFLVLSSTFARSPLNQATRYLLPLFAPVGLFAARGCLSVLDLRVTWKKWGLGLVLVGVGVTLSLSLVKSWHLVTGRNRGGLEVQRVARSLTANSEDNAVFLAYLWNDPVNYFGNRTTLFYRRMNLHDPAEFEYTLTQVVTSLLGDGLPVYYAEDCHPPLANSLELLRQNFDLHLWKESPMRVYQVLLEE